MKRWIVLLLTVVILLLTTIGVGGCGSSSPKADSADDRKHGEMSDDDAGSGPIGRQQEAEVEPATHDIEVPPAP